MRTLMTLGLAVLALTGAALLFVSGAGAEDDPTAAMAQQWEDAYNAGDMEAVAAMYLADGCRMPPHAPIAKGHDAILAELKAGREQGASRVDIETTWSETTGDSGHAMGTFEIMAADGTVVDRGKWMNVIEKVDGDWKTYCDIWNSDNPMPAAAEGA